jgi:hypothetical protein
LRDERVDASSSASGATTALTSPSRSASVAPIASPGEEELVRLLLPEDEWHEQRDRAEP